MADQNKLLKVLAAQPETALSLDAICQAFAPGKPFGPKTKLRKEVINAVGKLMQKELAVRAMFERKAFGGEHTKVAYSVTQKGLRLLADGGSVVGGKSGPRKNLPKPKADMRQRLWEALRIARKATVPELVELVRRDGDADAVKVIKNGLHYFNELTRAGVIARMATRAKGNAPTSNGFIRFALVKDLGPIAPSAGGRFVTDHNARARIDYKEQG